MSYNTDHLRTAGKITVYTSFIGVVIFAVVFIFNLGTTEIKEAGAQTSPEQASTTVTVLNTPPSWVTEAEEFGGTSTVTPTNAGDAVTWYGVASDANAERYYLLVCSTNATPTANSSAAPNCGIGAVQWAVSTSTTSGQPAFAATTTADSWSESNPWYAWVCDDNPGTPRCTATSTQGSGTTSSPFEVNHRPTFTAFWDTSPANPGQSVTFYSTSSDPDVSGEQDKVRLIVCSTNSFNTATDSCGGTLLGSTTVTAATTSNATATYTIVIPTQDRDDYGAYGFVIDYHGFEATGGSQGTDSVLVVSNVAPTVATSTIIINGGSNMVLTVASGETTGHTLQFTADDNNSCDAVNGNTYDEVNDFVLSLYRSGIGSSTCDGSAAGYNPNNCYPSGVPTTTWNLSCTASSTSCTFNVDQTDTSVVYNCTFPLWYVTDPTDGTATSTEYSTQHWKANVFAIDDDFATSAPAETATSTGVEVTSFLAFSLNTLIIPYGALQPGSQTDPLIATTTIAATGNVGLDKRVTGESMCTTYTNSTLCPNSSSSTIAESEQRFATGTFAYASATPLSSTTAQEIEINVPKSISTSTATTSSAYWGIRVPSAITLAGDYSGENTFIAIVGESSAW